MKVSAPVVIFVLLLLSAPAPADTPPDLAAKLTPILQPPLNQREQPFAGEAYFIGSPGYGRACSLEVNLMAMTTLDSTQSFRLARLKTYWLDIDPDSTIWEAPLDSGATRTLLFTFAPREVGTFQFILGRRDGKAWQNMANLVLSLDEDGNTLYAGSATEHRLTVVPPHPRRDSDTLMLRFPLLAETGDPRFDRHFTAEFRLYPPPAPKETTFVEFDLECQMNLYQEVQFILGHATSLKPSELPASWGNKAGPVEGYRFYHGRFWFIPLVPGLGVLNFRVMGTRPMMQYTERPATDFPIFFVTAEDGECKFIGYNNPWEPFGDVADPMLGSLSGLVELKTDDYRLKYIYSEPDYRGDEAKARLDSLKTDSADSPQDEP